jgi:hypothetical protein
MKLICEYLSNTVKPIFESAPQGGGKNTYLEGIFLQAEKKNRNNRIYPKAIMEEAVNKYNVEQVKTGRAVGELNHPESASINLDKVSHRITSLVWEGNNVIGKALILNTPMGLIVKGLLEGGVQLGVSSRGMGSIEEGREGASIVQDDFLLNTVDIVQDPSATEAFVNGIMEGVEFFYNKSGAIVAQRSDDLRKKFSKMSKVKLAEEQAKEFTKFLAALK